MRGEFVRDNSLIFKNGGKMVCKESQDLAKWELVLHTLRALLSGGRSPHSNACKSTIIFRRQSLGQGTWFQRTIFNWSSSPWFDIKKSYKHSHQREESSSTSFFFMHVWWHPLICILNGTPSTNSFFFFLFLCFGTKTLTRHSATLERCVSISNTRKSQNNILGLIWAYN
jgi:hypothetical protein